MDVEWFCKGGEPECDSLFKRRNAWYFSSGLSTEETLEWKKNRVASHVIQRSRIKIAWYLELKPNYKRPKETGWQLYYFGVWATMCFIYLNMINDIMGNITLQSSPMKIILKKRMFTRSVFTNCPQLFLIKLVPNF